MASRRLLLLFFYNWIVACTFLTAVDGAKLNCHELLDKVVVENPDFCEPTEPALGNLLRPVTLDFSKAKNETFQLLAKGFDQISGAFIMDGNEDVETLDFGEIASFEGKYLDADSPLISIRNNPNLKELKWNATVNQLSYNDKNQKLYILIYNNPQLNVTSLNLLKNAPKKSNIITIIQENTGDCQFQHEEYNSTVYTPPTAAILQHCKVIWGDFKMTGGSLAGLSLKKKRNTCLSLVNVDMTNTTISGDRGKLNKKCTDGVSIIKNNKNLCGTNMENLLKLFKNPDEIHAEIDNSSCTIKCTTAEQKQSKYNICEEEKEESTTIDSSSGGGGDNGNNGNNLNGNNGNTTSNSNNQNNNNNPPWLAIGIGLGIGGGLLLIVSIILIVLWKKRRLPRYNKPKKVTRKKDDDDMETCAYFNVGENIFGLSFTTFGCKRMKKTGPKFVADISSLSVATIREKFTAVDKIKLPAELIVKPPEPWKSTDGQIELGRLIIHDNQEYLIGARPKDKKAAAAFWHYLLEHEVRHFILLGEKDTGFLPLKLHQTIDLETIKITYEYEEFPVITTMQRTILIDRTMNGKRSQWKVVVDHYCSWYTDEPPSIRHGYEMFALLEGMTGLKIEPERGPQPKDREDRRMIVCKDGKERTGAFLLMDMIWTELFVRGETAEEMKPVDVDILLARLRTQIPNAVSDFRYYLYMHLLVMKKVIQKNPNTPYNKKFFEEAFTMLNLKDESEQERILKAKKESEEEKLKKKKEADNKQKPSEQTSKVDSKQKPNEQTSKADSKQKPSEQTSKADSKQKPSEQTSKADSKQKPSEQTSKVDSKQKPNEQTSKADSKQKPSEQTSKADSKQKPSEQTSKTQ